jgi:hypothetical protein
MAVWIDDLAVALGEDPLSMREIDTLLAVARDVAHSVERKVTPLSAFLLGAAVGRRAAAGVSRDEAMDELLATLRRALPPPS